MYTVLNLRKRHYMPVDDDYYCFLPLGVIYYLSYDPGTVMKMYSKQLTIFQDKDYIHTPQAMH